MTGLTTYPTKKWIVWTDGEYHSINIGYLDGSGQNVFTNLLYPSLIQVSTRTRYDRLEPFKTPIFPSSYSRHKSSHRRCSFKKAAVENLAIFTGKRLC